MPTVEMVQTAYRDAEPSIKKVLRALYGQVVEQDERPVTERIKTLEDACRELGEQHIYVLQYKTMVDELRAMEQDSDADDITAFLKLRIITEALNEGWKPSYAADEYRYYPYFYLYTQEEIDRMDENERAKLVLWGGAASNGSLCGLAYGTSDLAFSSSDAYYGARLAYKTYELAEYSGKQFTDIWKEFLVHKK
jgi:hypothetical protein